MNKILKIVGASVLVFLLMGACGNTWQEVGGRGVSDGMVSFCSIERSQDGYIYVAYKDQFSPPDCVPNPAVGHCGLGEISVIKWDGQDWNPVGEPRFSFPASFVSMQLYRDQPLVAFHDTQVNGQVSVMEFTGESWDYIGGQAGASDDVSYFVRLYVFQDQLFVSYIEEGSDMRASLRRWNGAFWEDVGERQFTPGPAHYLSVQMHNGMLYAAFKDGAQEGRVSVMLLSDGKWNYVGVPGFSLGEADFVNLTFMNGNPVVAYADYSLGGKLSAMQWNGTVWISLAEGVSEGVVNQLAVSELNGTLFAAFQDIRSEKNATDSITVMQYSEAKGWQTVGKPLFSGDAVDHVALFASESGIFTAFADNSVGNLLSVMRHELP